MRAQEAVANLRKNIRIAPKQGAPIRVNINGADFIDITNAVDISMGGVGLIVPHSFKGCTLKDEVSFIIDLPHEPKKCCVKVRGHILHISGNRFGVCFADMSDISRYKIKQYIAERIREQSVVNWMKYKVGLLH